MGQRGRILTQIVGCHGWRAAACRWETRDGSEVHAVAGFDVPPDCILVMVMERRWLPCCADCGAVQHNRRAHQRRTKSRRWRDLPWGTHPVILEYAAIRVHCDRCGGRGVEMLAWADRKQRQTRRLQHFIALDSSSMPLLHVAAKYGFSWHTVRRCEIAAIERWEQTRPAVPLVQGGIDEKWLGRRHKRKEKFVTIVSNLATGEPLWIGYGRDSAAVKRYLDTLTAEQKTLVKLFAMDMHRPFMNAIREDPALKHVAVVHDPFHVMKRAGDAVTELRREVFFRGGKEMRAIGRGTRWLLLRPWEKTGDDDRATLRHLFSLNGRLARAYQVVEEVRQALHAPDHDSMSAAFMHVLRRTEKRNNVPMRKLHDSLVEHMPEILAFGEHHPPTGRIEALNNNWEALVRRGRGYRNHDYLLRKLRFMIANPIRTADGTKRFLALGIMPPPARPLAA